MHRQLLKALLSTRMRSKSISKTGTMADLQTKTKDFLEDLIESDVTKNLVAIAINRVPEMDQCLTELL